METVTLVKEVFEYSELDSAAQEKALAEFIESFDFEWHADCVIEDAKTIGALMGWDVEDIGYSGFWSQGDGAHFTGRMGYKKGCAKNVAKCASQDKELARIATDWQKLQARNFYALSADVRHSGHYQHENCTSFDCYDSRDYHGYLQNSDTKDAIEEIARDFMRWIYRRLENEYEYQTSEPVVIEFFEANEIRFLENGVVF